MSKQEFWVLQRGIPAVIGETAARLESQGWDGLALTDNTNLTGDNIIAMTLATLATKRIHIVPGVINPVTRQPVVLAAAAANLQDLSGGRTVMAIGRGDSSLAYLGMAPMKVADFEEAVRQLSRFLRGEGISLAEAARWGGAPPIEGVGYAHLPTEARIEWMTPGQRIPLEVVGSGPKVIAAGARHADRITVAVGADVPRLRWAVNLARQEAEKVGRDPSELTFGAYIQTACHPDAQHAADISKGVVASLARFMSLGGKATVPVDDRDREVIEQITGRYDMTQHGKMGEQAQVIDDEFAQRFSILGPPDACAARFSEVFEAGIDRVYVNTVHAGTPEEQLESLERLATEVLPQFRAVSAA